MTKSANNFAGDDADVLEAWQVLLDEHVQLAAARPSASATEGANAERVSKLWGEVRAAGAAVPGDQRDATHLAEVCRIIHAGTPTWALCLSGGGIRSATFNLGLIQGLAKAGYLDTFDYLSTVSGGGYIGAWLTAWTQRETGGIPVVSHRLAAGTRPADATGASAGEGSTKVAPSAGLNLEPAEVSHLREYSNFLTPRLRGLSRDTWSLLATVPRNLILNWMVVLPLLAAVFSVVWLWVAASMQLQELNDRANRNATFALFYVGLELFLCGLCFAVPLAPFWSRQSDERVPGWLQVLGRWRPVVFVVVPIYVGSLITASALPASKFEHGQFWTLDIALAAFVPLMTCLTFLCLLVRGKRADVRRVTTFATFVKICGTYTLAIPAMYGVLLLSRWLVPGVNDPSNHAMLSFWLGPPTWLVMAFCFFTVIVALTSEVYSPDMEGTREWWSTLIAQLLLFGVRSTVLSRTWEPVQRFAADSADPAARQAKRLMLAALDELLDDRQLLQEAYRSGKDGGERLVERVPDAVPSDVRLAFRQMAADGSSRTCDRLILEDRLRTSDGQQLLLQRLMRPFHGINAALNLVGGKKLAWQQRMATNFTFTPLHCGFDGGYRQTVSYANGVSLGNAITASGAAASPNMGDHLSSAVTALLTLFNVRLGCWLGNTTTASQAFSTNLRRACAALRLPRPRPTYRLQSPRFSVRPLLDEALGRTDGRNGHIYLSDGGHFENLGLCEMFRRRCKLILVSDASCDPDQTTVDLGNAVRKVRIDLGVHICMRRVNFSAKSANVSPARYCTVGQILDSDVDTSPDGTPVRDGLFIYSKPALLGTEPIDVFRYSRESEAFPHESTADQWFDESQFESYRRLGETAAECVLGTMRNLDGELARDARLDIDKMRQIIESYCDTEAQARGRVTPVRREVPADAAKGTPP